MKEPRKAARRSVQDKSNILGRLIVVGGLIAFGFYSCVYESPAELKERETAERAALTEKSENDRKGFNCLSGWDGSNASLVSQVKEQLRDPGSFEHAETKITPRDSKGQHMLTMKYRARNGFGGMNVGQALATVDGSTCEATLVTAGSLTN